jgi:hypothetical protein
LTSIGASLPSADTAGSTPAWSPLFVTSTGGTAPTRSRSPWRRAETAPIRAGAPTAPGARQRTPERPQRRERGGGRTLTHPRPGPRPQRAFQAGQPPLAGVAIAFKIISWARRSRVDCREGCSGSVRKAVRDWRRERREGKGQDVASRQAASFDRSCPDVIRITAERAAGPAVMV